MQEHQQMPNVQAEVAAPQLAEVVPNQMEIEQQQDEEEIVQEKQQGQGQEQEQDQVQAEQSIDYKELLNSYERNLTKMSNQNASRLVRINALNQKLDDALSELERQRQNNCRLTEKVDELTVLNQQHTNKMNELKHKYQTISQKLKEFEKKDNRKELQDKLQESQTLVKALKIEVDNKDLQIRANRNSNREGTESVQSLRMLENLNSQIKQKDAQIAKLLKNVKTYMNANHLISGEFESFKSQYEVLKQQKCSLQFAISTLNQQKQESMIELNNLKVELKDKEQQILNLQNKLENQIKRKRQISSNNYLEQKESILKQFLQLEKQHVINQELLEKQRVINDRLEETLRHTLKNSVKKIEFDALCKKYMQAKRCLENALKKAKDNGTVVSISSEHHNNDNQNSFKKVLMEQETHHYDRFRQTIEQNKELKKQNPEHLIEVLELKQKINQLTLLKEEHEKVIGSYLAMLEDKAATINRLHQKCAEYSSQLDSMNSGYHAMETENRIFKHEHELIKLRFKNNESRILDLLDYIETIEKENCNWKLAYQTVKNQIENKKFYQEKQVYNQEVEKEQKLEVKVINIPKRIPVKTSQTQTETESVDLHLRELKGLAAALKDLPKKLEQLIEPMNSTKMDLEELKTKYNSSVEKYNIRFSRLNKNIAENEAWRNKAKEELEKHIREEYSEIKEFIENERLLNALKRAKYLIDEFEKEEANEEANDNDDDKVEEQLAL